MDNLEFYGKVNLLKGGIVSSDSLPRQPQVCGGDSDAGIRVRTGGVLRARADRLQGILNGVDYEPWTPPLTN